MVFLILLLALLLRLIIINQSLWLDEAINVIYAQQNDFWWFVTKYPIGDFHPPGYFSILWVWGRVFGFSEISVRIPSLIFGLGTIIVTYLIGKKLFSEKVGLLAALFLSIAPLHVYYSQEARMYSFAAFAVSISTYFFISFVNKERFASFFYALSIGLVFYSDYVAYLILLTHIAYVFLSKRDFIQRYLSVLAMGLVFVLPWMWVFPNQLLNGKQTASIISGWGNVVGGAGIKELLLLPVKAIVGRISISKNIFYILLAFGLFLPYLVCLLKIKKLSNDKFKLLLLWLFVPIIFGFLISTFIPIFAYFRFIFVLPAAYIILAMLVLSFKKNLPVLVICLILLSQLISVLIYNLNPKFQREDWKSAVAFIDEKAEKESLIIFENEVIPAPYIFYSQDLKNTKPALKKIPVFSELDVEDFDSESIYLFEYLKDVTDPNYLVEKKLLNSGYKNIETYNFNGVGLIKFYKR